MYIVIALLLLLIVMPTAVVWYGLSFKPDYWEPIDQTRPEVRQSAERFEQSLREQVRPPPAPRLSFMPGPSLTPGRSEPVEWTVEITQEQLNVWLRVRLTEWGANRGFDPRVLELLSRGMISIELGAVEVAVPFKKAAISGVIRLRYRPTAAGDGRVRLMAEDAHAGLAPVPIATAIESILSHVPQGDESEIERLRARARALDLLIPLRDGRLVGVIDMALLPGKAIVTFRTLS
jgi:hypothetical protein